MPKISDIASPVFSFWPGPSPGRRFRTCTNLYVHDSHLGADNSNPTILILNGPSNCCSIDLPVKYYLTGAHII